MTKRPGSVPGRTWQGTPRPVAQQQATLVKLLRISLLAVVVAAVALAVRKSAPPETARPPLLPGFLLAFLALVALHSLNCIPQAWQLPASHVSQAGLVVAIAALGIKTSPRALVQAGWRAITMLVLETLWLAALMAVAAWWLSRR